MYNGSVASIRTPNRRSGRSTSSADQKSVSSSPADEKSKPDITPSLKPSHYIFVEELDKAAELFESVFTGCDIKMFHNSFLRLRELYFTKADMVDPGEKDSPGSKDSLALEKQELPDFFIYGKMLANIREGKLVLPLLEQFLEQHYNCKPLNSFRYDLRKDLFYKHNFWDEEYVDPLTLMLAYVICYYKKENKKNQERNFFLCMYPTVPFYALDPLKRLARHRRILPLKRALGEKLYRWRNGLTTEKCEVDVEILKYRESSDEDYSDDD